MTTHEFKANGVELALEEGSKAFCGSTGVWNANYVVGEPPSPWFFFFFFFFFLP